ncbi:MAG: hypothetical protein EPO07_02015 [Verrucomicrobia bacterium]|nr:MAG: hypothetical protein EPO07_02015 [Verrucomicrobiota bacterium]
MTENFKRGLTAVAAVAVIAASALWIYRAQTSDRKQNVALHTHIGEVLAEQTAALAGKKARVVTLSIETKEWPELKTQIAAFKAQLKKLGDYEVREYEMDTKDQPKYGVGSGLSGRRYVRTVNKNKTADIFVSFIGAPHMTKEDLAELETKPKLVVEARAVDNLSKLFQHQILEVAVVSRFQFPSPAPEKPKTTEEWFIKRYQIVTATNAAGLPKPEPD